MKQGRRTRKLEERRHEAVRQVIEEGKEQAQVAREMKASRRSVVQWVSDYRRGGYEALKAQPRSGRPRFLTDEQHEGLRRDLLSGAQANGFDSDLWDCKRVQTLIARKYRVRYHIDHIPKLLRRLGFSPQKPEHRAYERDEAKIEGWIHEDWERIKKIA